MILDILQFFVVSSDISGTKAPLNAAKQQELQVGVFGDASWNFKLEPYCKAISCKEENLIFPY